MTRVHCLCGAWNDADLLRSCPACSRPARGISGFLRSKGMQELEREAVCLASDAGRAQIEAVFAAHKAGVSLGQRRAA